MTTSKSLSLILALVIIIAILGGLYYYTNKGPLLPASAPEIAYTTANPATTTSAVEQPMADGAEGSVVGDNLALGLDSNTALGTYLIAYNGMTLYTYAPDKQTPGASACTGACATNWPPYVVGPEDNLTHLEAGVSGSVDTITRADGSLQVTYNGAPLYFYIKDTASGQTNGQGVGGVWYVVTP